ncbi:alpha/beta hydrolase [Marinomonas sp.]|nr:alpha/beta hydrolase [Marinomonas sp.]MDB4837409.1 alpha/beta hydrolase [Marinomonas sp.]
MSFRGNTELVAWHSPVKEGVIHGYESLIDANSPTIHFLHGNGFSARTYSCFLQQLDNYNLILQNAAGHGDSTVGNHFVGWNGTAERFLDSLEKQQDRLPNTGLIGMGHSFGGCMTLLMNQSKSSVFSSMILLDPAFFPPRLVWMMRAVKVAGLRRHLPLAKKARRRRTRWETYADVRGNFHERGTFKGWESACLEDYISSSIKQSEDGCYYLGCPPWMEAEIFSTYPKGGWKAIKNISVPTYIVQGKDTFPYFKEAYKLAASLNPNVKVVEVEGGHCFMQQHSKKSAKAVLEILDRLSQ